MSAGQHTGVRCDGRTRDFDSCGVGSIPAAPANGLEVENVLLRALWVKRNVGLAHHRNHTYRSYILSFLSLIASHNCGAIFMPSADDYFTGLDILL